MSSLKTPILKRKVRRLVGVFLLGLIVLCVFRNPIAKLALIQLSLSAVGVQLEIDEIRVGWTEIEIVRLRINEPEAPELPQLETGSIRIAFTLQAGFRTGSWAKRVDVRQPTLHLRFDNAGNLISRFPKSSRESGTGEIPIRELHIRDAAIVIHQNGREPFTVDGIRMIGQFSDSIRVRGELPSVFGGKVVLQANLNAATLAGQSNLAIERIALDAKQLERLPLLPDFITQLGLSADLNASAAIEHPNDPFDLSRYEAKMVSVLQNAHSTKHGALVDRIECSATSTGGIVKVKVVGNPFAGRIDAEFLADLKQDPISAEATLKVQSCDLRALAAEFALDARLQAKTSVAAKAHFTYQDQRLKFKSGLNARLDSISILDVPVDDILCSFLANGEVPISDVFSLSGSVKGAVESQGIAISDIANRLQLPIATGQVSAKAEFEVPLSKIAEPEFYSIQANVKTTDISIAEFTLDDSTAIFAVEHAAATAAVNNVTIRDQNFSQVLSFAATANANLAAHGKVAAALEMEFSPNEELYELLGISSLQPQGNVRGTVSASNRLDHISQPETWTATTTIHGTKLAIAGEAIGDLAVKCELIEGSIVIPQFEIPWKNSKWVSSGSGTIVGGLAFDGAISTNSIQIKDIAGVATRLSNQQLNASGNARLNSGFRIRIPAWNLHATDIQTSGQVNVSDARFATTNVGGIQLSWEANPNNLTVKSNSSDFFGGSYGIEATMPGLDWTKTIIRGQFRDVQATRLVELSRKRLPVSGVFSGGIELTEIGNIETAKGVAWATSRGFVVQRIPVEFSKCQLTWDSGLAEFASEGTASRGKFSTKARTSIRGLLEFAQSEERQIEAVPLLMNAQLADFPVMALREAWPFPAELRSLQGNISTEVNRGVPMLDGRKLCDVTCTLEDLQLNQIRLSDRIVGEISVRHDRANMTRITGRLADGQLSGRAELSLSANPSGTFEIAANRMSLRRIGKAVARDQDLAGSGTVSVRGRIGQQISGHADLKLDRGVFGGVSVREAKFPIDWSYSQPSRIARWQCRTGLISMGGGKIRVASEGSYGTSLNMSTGARVERIDSSKLMVGKSIGAGTITGDVQINAKRARSLKQLTGRFDFELVNPKALELPILDQIPTVVSLTPSRPGVGQDGGYVAGRLAGGLVHVDQLAIVQSNIQVLMSGNSTQEGRLDFDVTVNTNASGPADQLLELANTPLMLAAPAPVALIAKANNLLKDRVVHVHVGGIATRPTIQLQPGKQLSQGAVKFFLSNALGSQAAEIATRRPHSKRR